MNLSLKKGDYVRIPVEKVYLKRVTHQIGLLKYLS